MQLKDYQSTYIYEPIVDKINQNLNQDNVILQYQVLALSTSAGKTFTVANFCVKYCLENGCDVILTSPNGASLEEIKDDMVTQYPDAYIQMATGFAGGEPFVAPETDQRVIILCHPTFLSQQKFEIRKWAQGRKLVLFSDEAHKGFMCSDAEDTFEAFGYKISEYTAEWHKCLHVIPSVAWFLLSATPLRTTFSGKEFAHISEYFDKDTLCEEQAAVKNVKIYGNPVSILNNNFSDLFYDAELSFDSSYIKHSQRSLYECLIDLKAEWAEEDKWLAEATKKYSFPQAQPARVVQAKDQWDSRDIFGNLKKDTALNIGSDKKVFGFNSNDYLRNFPSTIRSQDIINHINDKSTRTSKIVANKLVGEAVNIPNLNCLVSFHERNSVQDDQVTHSVEQLLGRLIRWPEVEGIENWPQAIAYAEKCISHGVPRDDMYKWISMVFEYDVYMVASKNNVSGIEAFFRRHTYNPEEWKEYQNRLICEEINKQKTRRKYGDSPKTPHAQAGSQSYKNYKNTVRECEYCPKEEYMGQVVPACKIPVLVKAWSEEEYFAGLDVHHTEGREDTATMNDFDKLRTVCKPVHQRLDDELRVQKKVDDRLS